MSTTIERYRCVVKEFLTDHPATRAGALAFIAEKAACNGRYLRFMTSVLTAFLRWWSPGQAENLYPDLPRLQPPARPAFTEDEVKRMLAQADTECSRDSLVLRLLAMGGLKRCDLKYATPGSAKHDRLGYWLEIKRPRGPYNAPIDAGTFAMLRGYKPCDHPNAATEKPPWKLGPCAIRKIVEHYRDKCGIQADGAGCMAFRRAYATGRHRRGAGMKELQDDLGLKTMECAAAAVKGRKDAAKGYDETMPVGNP